MVARHALDPLVDGMELEDATRDFVPLLEGDSVT